VLALLEAYKHYSKYATQVRVVGVGGGGAGPGAHQARRLALVLLPCNVNQHRSVWRRHARPRPSSRAPARVRACQALEPWEGGAALLQPLVAPGGHRGSQAARALAGGAWQAALAVTAGHMHPRLAPHPLPSQAIKAANLPKNMKNMKSDAPLNPRQLQQQIQNMGRALPPQLLKQMGGMGGLGSLMKAMEGMGPGGMKGMGM
jgi:hypothetical protein